MWYTFQHLRNRLFRLNNLKSLVFLCNLKYITQNRMEVLSALTFRGHIVLAANSW